MEFDTFDLIRIFTSLQLLLLSIALLIVKTKNNHQKLLSLFLFSQAVYILLGIFGRFHHYFKNNDFKSIFYIFYAFTYLIGPSLYFYVKHVIGKDYKIRSRHIFHIVLFIVFLLLNYPYLHVPSVDVFLFYRDITPDIYSIVTIAIFHVQILAYLVYSTCIVEKHIRNNKNSNDLTRNGKNRLNWIRFLLYSFLLLWLIESLIYFTYSYYHVFLCHIKIILAFLQFITANLIVFQGLKSPQLFDGNSDKPKYYKNIIKVEDKELYLKRLLQYMKDETPYLNPQISLNDIASKLNITTNLLSQLLNTTLKMSFYDFINSFRIEEAKKLLLSYNPKQKTILEILYEVGFSSKSAFNIAFKKQTGVTPTVFRNQKS